MTNEEMRKKNLRNAALQRMKNDTSTLRKVNSNAQKNATDKYNRLNKISKPMSGTESTMSKLQKLNKK